MPFSDFVGQEPLLKYLQKCLQSGRLNHALLFSGPKGSGKGTLALLVGQALNCSEEEGEVPCGICLPCRKIQGFQHPDVRVIARDGANIKIEQIRGIKQDAAREPYEGKKRVFILDNAEDMTAPAANSLLKLLEEPPPYAVFILLSCRPELLLTTIRSRCQGLPFRPAAAEAIASFLMSRNNELLPGEARTYASLAQGSVGRALQLVEDESFEAVREGAAAFLPELLELKDEDLFTMAEKLAGQKEVALFLDLTLLFLRDILLYRSKSPSDMLYYSDFMTSVEKFAAIPEKDILVAISSVLSARKELAAPVNQKLVLGVMLLELKEVI